VVIFAVGLLETLVPTALFEKGREKLTALDEVQYEEEYWRTEEQQMIAKFQFDGFLMRVVSVLPQFQFESYINTIRKKTNESSIFKFFYLIFRCDSFTSLTIVSICFICNKNFNSDIKLSRRKTNYKNL
jgi:hypothetical protein